MPARMTKAQLRGLGVLPSKPKKRGMNRWERSFADVLEQERLLGVIRSWAWEAIKLRLADRTWYTPDFYVILLNGQMEFREVKGFMRDDAAVKIKVAAELYPWRFVIVRKTKGGSWEYETVPGKRGS